MKRLIHLIVVVILSTAAIHAQPLMSKGQPVLDQVAAVVGNNIILSSDIESQSLQFSQQSHITDADLKCKVLDQLLLNKLLLHQAGIDSLEVTDDQVNQKIDQNLSYYTQQLGGTEKLEAFYGKSIPELKEEFKPLVRDQLKAQQMQQKITKGITVSPAEIKVFYNSIPPDSLPYINAEVEYAQIVRRIPISKEQKDLARQRLEELRNRILKGEDFATLAVLYSTDKESARNGGELGFLNRGELVPAFEAVAFRLKNSSQVSEIVETQFGLHIIQLIERRGEKINVRHILIKPESTADDLVAAQHTMDSVAQQLKAGTLKFTDAAEKFSDDTDTKLNGGTVMNANSGSSRFQADQVDPGILFQLDKMSVGEISNPVLTTTKEGYQAYRILMLKTRVEPHRLNMNDDYQKLQELTLTDKQQRAVESWRNKKKTSTYIRISDDYQQCSLLKDWLIP